MCGISGSGKTFYAQKLEENEGYIRLSTDKLIWDKVGERLYDLPDEEKHRLFALCRQEILDQLEALLKSGRKVVVDATHCKRKARDEMRDLCARAGVKPVFAYCDASREELWQRLSQRKGTGADDLIVTQKEFSQYWQGFERPQSDESDFILI